MKIVLINDRLNAGGAEKVLVYIANLLYKMKINIIYILIRNEDFFQNNAVNFEFFYSFY